MDDDGDRLTDEEEVTTYQTNPLAADSDEDGMDDGWEVRFSLNPLVSDADIDSDNDGFSNLEEYLAKSDPRDDQNHPHTPIDALTISNDTSCAIIENKIECWGLRRQTRISRLT